MPSIHSCYVHSDIWVTFGPTDHAGRTECLGTEAHQGRRPGVHGSAVTTSEAEPGGPLTAADRPKASGWGRFGLIAYALIGGVAIFVGGTPYFELTAANDNAIYNAALVGFFGLLTLLLRHRQAHSPFVTTSYALFVASSAMLALVVGPFNWMVTAENGSVEQATQDKLAQFLSVVPVILLVTWATKRSRQSIYLQKGLPKRWLPFGLGSLVIAAIVITVVALATGIKGNELISASPWILAFAALNAVMEELWFRGIFLRPYTAGMGTLSAVLVTAVIFGLAHVDATYLSEGENLWFVLLVIGFGIVTAWAMRWADTLWGAALFHMGLDLVVVLQLLDIL